MTFDPRYYVTFSSDNGLSVQVLVDAASPTLSGGLGGWEVVDRPKRVGITRWKGKDPFRQNIAILFDGERSQEADIDKLVKMGGTGAGQPPIIQLSGFALRTDLYWIIENNIDWDDQNVIWSMEGAQRVRLRQAGVVHLLQFVDDDVIITATTPAASNTTKNDPTSHRTTQPGETLKQIAQIVYGNPARYLDILYANSWLNPDPRSIIPAGTVLSIPGQTAGFVVV